MTIFCKVIKVRPFIKKLFSKVIRKRYLHFLRILTGKKHPKINSSTNKKYEIWACRLLVHQINSFQEVLKLKQIFQKNKAVTGKTPLFVIGQFCSRRSICLNIDFDRAVLNENDAFSILVVSTKKHYPSFLKKVFVFQKI